MRPVLVAGTDSWKGKNDKDWFCPGHLFGQFLTAQGVAPIYGDDGTQPFVWSTDLDGVPGISSGTKDWQAGGAALSYFSRLLGAEAYIVHSHGLQVMAFAAKEHGLKAKVVISMGSPIREDLTAEYQALRDNTGTWLHVHSDNGDRFQVLGELFDGHVGIVREASLAHKNDFVAGVGHSELLRDPKNFHYWVDKGWIALLKG